MVRWRRSFITAVGRASQKEWFDRRLKQASDPTNEDDQHHHESDHEQQSADSFADHPVNLCMFELPNVIGSKAARAFSRQLRSHKR